MAKPNDTKAEINQIKHKYFCRESVPCYFWDNSSQEALNVFHALNAAQDWNKPDGFAIMPDYVYIFEHFEFDAYRRTKSGSKFKQNDAAVYRDFAKEAQNATGNIHTSTIIPGTPTMQDYIANIRSLFSKHLEQVASYKENMSKEYGPFCKDFRIIFVVEDTTALGSVLQNGQPLILPRCDAFLDLFEQQHEVDGVVSFSFDGRGQYPICYMNHDNIPTLHTEMIHTDDVELIPWQTHVSQNMIEIPKESFDQG